MIYLKLSASLVDIIGRIGRLFHILGRISVPLAVGLTVNLAANISKIGTSDDAGGKSVVRQDRQVFGENRQGNADSNDKRK